MRPIGDRSDLCSDRSRERRRYNCVSDQTLQIKSIADREDNMDNFTEKMIENVKKHGALFNLAHPDYKNVRIKNKIWDEIAKELKLGSTGGKDLKKRWKNLRDCYSKYLRSEKTQTGQQAKSICHYKTWPWAQHMEAFRSSFQFAQTESNIPDPDIESPNELFEETESVNEPCQTPENRLSPKLSGPGRGGRKRKLLEETSQPSSVEKIINFLEKKHDRTEKANDEIDLIFMGYAASVKRLPPRSQTLIKFKIAKMIMYEELSQQAEIERECRAGTSISNSTLSSATNIDLGPLDDNIPSHAITLPYASGGQELSGGSCPSEA